MTAGKACMRWLMAFFVLVAAQAHASAPRASLDRDHVTLGDTVTLTLTFDNASSIRAPDLSPLRKDFQILGQASNAEQSWVNGHVQASYKLQITLRPLHAGTLHVPSLDVDGKQTRVLTLDVKPGSTQPKGQPGGPVFLKVELSTRSPYVGEQVAMDVRLFYQAALVNGNKPEPHVDGAHVTPLGRMQRYQTTIGGQSYFVAEQHFALVPEHAGKLEVPPVQFSGRMLNASPMGTFFSNVRPVTAQSGAFTLTVRPRPASVKRSAWLPVRHLELSLDGLPASGKVQVGEPLTITLREGATGISASDLPALSLPSLSGADVYPDKSDDVTRNNGQWVTGSRTRRFAIVPNRQGTLQIPSITLPWWNVVKDRAETAVIPAHTLTVVAAPASAASAPAPTASAPSPAATPSQATPAPVASAAGKPSREGVWRKLAVASLVLWLVSLLAGVAWWMRSRRGPADPTPAPAPGAAVQGSARSRRLAFLAASRSGDPHAAAQALLAWAQSERTGIRHLQDLADRLDDAGQRRAIRHLQDALFAPRPSGGGEDVTAAFRPGLAWRGARPRDEEEALPPLYPRHRERAPDA